MRLLKTAGGAVLLLTALTACQYTPVSSLIALSRFDFNTTDPSSFRAALALPKAIVPQQTVLRLVTAIDGGPERRDDLPLERFDDLAIAEVLPKGDAAGLEKGTYRLSAADAAKFSAHRAWMRLPRRGGFRSDHRMRSWHILLTGGLLGVASLMLVPFERLTPMQLPALQLRLLTLVQPAILTVLAVWAGAKLAPKVALRAPLVEAWLAGGEAGLILRRQLPMALIVALIVATVLVVYGKLVSPLLASGSGAAPRLAAFELPLPTKILYGGVTEELLTRWGLVSLFAWALWRLRGRPAVLPSSVYWIAIVLAAVLFAAGHIPLLLAISQQPPAWLVGTVLIANAGPGVLFGWLFWKRGLEAAIIAHGLAHILAMLAMPFVGS